MDFVEEFDRLQWSLTPMELARANDALDDIDMADAFINEYALTEGHKLEKRTEQSFPPRHADAVTVRSGIRHCEITGECLPFSHRDVPYADDPIYKKDKKKQKDKDKKAMDEHFEQYARIYQGHVDSRKRAEEYLTDLFEQARPREEERQRKRQNRREEAAMTPGVPDR